MWDQKESPGPGRISCFLCFKLQVALPSQAPHSAQTLGRTGAQHGRAGFARGAVQTRGSVFVDRGGAPALAERGLPLGGGGLRVVPGKLPQGQSPGPAPFTVITARVSHLATSTLPLRAPSPEVFGATFAKRPSVSEGRRWTPDAERKGSMSGLGL